MTLDEASMTPLIDTVVQLMETKCIRLNGHAVDWRALFDDAKTQLTRSDSVQEFEKRMNRVLMKGAESRRLLPSGLARQTTPAVGTPRLVR